VVFLAITSTEDDHWCANSPSGSREVDDKLDTKTTYEVYQHVSEALKKFDLNDELPQWELK
jgi:hypothetical protein